MCTARCNNPMWVCSWERHAFMLSLLQSSRTCTATLFAKDGLEIPRPSTAWLKHRSVLSQLSRIPVSASMTGLSAASPVSSSRPDLGKGGRHYLTTLSKESTLAWEVPALAYQLRPGLPSLLNRRSAPEARRCKQFSVHLRQWGRW